MSNDTEALAEIIARLEKATGADQEIDQLIAVFVSIIKNPERKVVAVANCTPYTSSLDAIVGLIERALPGCGDIVAFIPYVTDEKRRAYGAVILPDRQRIEANAPTRALALCLAFARALQARTEGDKR